MEDNLTKISNLIDPEVMADMISAKLPKKIRVAPFAKVDTTLEGAEGDTVTVPKFAYIGDAEDVAEGVECGMTTLEASSEKVTVKKAMKGVTLTDEAVLSAHGDPVGEANNQLALSIASKIDNDCMDALSNEDAEGRLKYNGSANELGYEGIVDAIDVFEEEVNGEKAMFVHPKQVTTLRKDPNFISADKYNQEVVLKGEIGMIANTRIVPSKKVKEDKETTSYLNPIIKLETEEETEEDTPALTIYLKRGLNVEKERKSRKRATEITVDEMYAVSVSNDSKVVLAKFKKKSSIETIKVSVPSEETSLNIGEKTVQDLCENVSIEGNNVKGSLKHVENWTEFSKTDNSGNFLPLYFEEAKGQAKGTVKVELKGTGAKLKKPVAVDEKDGLIVFQIHNKDNTLEITQEGKEARTLNLSQLDLKTE